MNPSFAAVVLFALTIPALEGADNDPAAMSADELAGRMNAARLGSAAVRVRLETESPGTGKRVFQLQIKERRTRAGTDLVYEVLWPKERKGEAVILHQSGSGAPSGSMVVQPNTVRPLKASDMDEGLFGSDLSYQDAIENFFAWKDQTVTGSETLDGVPCLILESKPGRSDATIYGKVRSWIDPRRFVPMRVEKYSNSGQLVRRIDTTRVSRDEGRRPIPSRLTVQGTRKDSVTELTGARIDQDVKFSDRDFTPEGLGK
ncbi:MAG: outer membrane lipoprotein-sorting protein [Chthoniobacteraceae bacterium]